MVGSACSLLRPTVYGRRGFNFELEAEEMGIVAYIEVHVSCMRPRGIAQAQAQAQDGGVNPPNGNGFDRVAVP